MEKKDILSSKTLNYIQSHVAVMLTQARKADERDKIPIPETDLNYMRTYDKGGVLI